MGIYDREYIRDDEPQGFRLRMPQTMVVTLILVNVAVFVADMFTATGSFGGVRNHWLMDSLACSPKSLTNPLYAWQLITYGFAHSTENYFHIGFNMLVLFMFGPPVEERIGKWEFLRFYLLAILAGSLVFALRQLLFVPPDLWNHCIGASGAVTAVMTLFIFFNPHSTIYLMMVLPVKAWVAGIIFLVLNIFGSRGSYGPDGDNIAYDVHLAGAAFAGAYYMLRLNFGNWMPASLPLLFKKSGRILRGKPSLKVHAPEEDWREAEQRYQDLDEKADRLLEKIAREGEGSLTDAERRILEDYARRMRQKHR